jgi:hypothetical protein
MVSHRRVARELGEPARRVARHLENGREIVETEHLQSAKQFCFNTKTDFFIFAYSGHGESTPLI